MTTTSQERSSSSPAPAAAWARPPPGTSPRRAPRVVLGARRIRRIEALAAEITAAGGKALGRRDRRHGAGRTCSRLVDTAVETYGRIDVLINNAGVMPLSPLERLKVDEWDRMIDVNLKGVLYGIAAALPHMKEQKSGHIINLSSVAGHKLFGGSAVYSATKFARAGPVRGAAAGSDALQHPRHDHLAGRGQDGAARPHQRGGRPEGEPGLRGPGRRARRRPSRGVVAFAISEPEERRTSTRSSSGPRARSSEVEHDRRGEVGHGTGLHHRLIERLGPSRRATTRGAGAQGGAARP